MKTKKQKVAVVKPGQNKEVEGRMKSLEKNVVSNVSKAADKSNEVSPET